MSTIDVSPREPLKVNIEGRKLLKIRGLTIPVSPIVLTYGMGPHVNLLDIYVWCKTCMVEHGTRKAVYYCETEQAYVCAVCNGFCFMKAHTWKDLFCNVDFQKQTAHRPK